MIQKMCSYPAIMGRAGQISVTYQLKELYSHTKKSSISSLDSEFQKSLKQKNKELSRKGTKNKTS